MIDNDDLIRRAFVEIGRLNRELAAIHEDEERCRLRRSRIEAQKAQVQLFVDQANLARRLAAQPDDPNAPKVWIERHCGVGIVHVEPRQPTPPPQELPPPVESRRTMKPAGIPPVSAMIVAALQATGKASRPIDIVAFVRQRWWAAASTKTIATTAWLMAKAGKLTHHDGRYGLSSAGHNGAGH